MRLLSPGSYLDKRVSSAVELPLRERELLLELYTEYKTDNVHEGNQGNFLSVNKEALAQRKIPVALFYSDREMYLPYYLLANDKKLLKHFYFTIYENPSKELLKLVKIKATELPRLSLFIPRDGDSEVAQPYHYGAEFVYSKMKRFLDNVYTII